MIAARVEHLRVGLEDESRDMTRQLNEVAIRFVIAALKQLGFAWQVGLEISQAEIDARIPTQNRPKITRVLGRLVEHGWLNATPVMGHVSNVPHGWRVTRPEPHGSADELLDEIERNQRIPNAIWCAVPGRRWRRSGAAMSSR